MQKIEYTHKGWFLFCPIWIADWDSEVPAVAPRYKLEPLFWLAKQFFYFMSSMNEMKTGGPLLFCFMVNLEPLKKPVVHYYE